MSRKNNGEKNGPKLKPRRQPRKKTQPCFRSVKGGKIICLCCRGEVSQGKTDEHRKNCPTFKVRKSVSLAEISV